jgi:hypothetical protein
MVASGGQVKALTLLLLLIAPVAAHNLPVHPIKATLLVDEGRIRADIEMDGALVVEEVLGEIPPGPWSTQNLEKAKGFLDRQFSLSVDGQELVSRLSGARFVQEGWQKARQVDTYGWAGVFHFRLTYDVPLKAERLAGRAAFFAEERDLLEKNKITPTFHTEFLTHLKVPGSRPTRINLTLDAPTFSLAISDARRAPWQRWHEAAAWAFAPVPWAIATLWVLVAVLAFPRCWRAGITGFLAIGVALEGYLLELLGLGGGATAGWLAAVVMGGVLCMSASGPKWTLAVLVSAYLWGLSLSSAYSVVDTLPVGAIEGRVAFFLGALLSVGVTVVVMSQLLRVYRHSLSSHSEQSAESLYRAHVRFAAAAAAALGLLQAVKSL